MRNASGLPQGGAKWKPVRLGGVGFVTGWNISADEVTQVCRIDVFGCYVKSSGDKIWRQAFTPSTLATGDCPNSAGYTAPAAGLVDNPGGYEIVVAPNDNQRLYAVWNARTWKSTDAGKTWTHLTGVPDILAQSNSGNQPHNHGFNMAVDPQNKDVVLLGTQNNGLYYTTNGGSAWTNVALGTNSSRTENGESYQHPSKVVCDQTSTVTGGIHQTWYAVLQGTGVRKTTTGPGGSYSAMTGALQWVGDLAVDTFGNVWATDPSNTATNNVWKCAAGGTTWAQVGTPYLTDGAVAILVDPTTPGYVVIIGSDGQACHTTDSGATWSSTTAAHLNTYAYSIPWLGANGPSSISFGMARFFPITSGRFGCSGGVGTYICDFPSGSTTIKLQEHTEGIECSDANNMVEGLGQSPIFGIWDQGAWRMDDLDHSWRGYNNRAPAGSFTTSVAACWDVDVASDNPAYVAALINFGGQHAGYSTDGWNTCQTFPTLPPLDFLGGCICCGPQGQVLINQSGGDHGNWGAPYYTKDGGTTWGLVNVPGVTASFTGHIDNGSGSAGTTLTVTAMNFGTIAVGMSVSTAAGSGGNGALGFISGQITGTTGGVGTYTFSASKLVTATTFSATAGGFGGSADYVNRKNVAYDALAGKYYMTNYGADDGSVSFASNAGIYSTADLASAWTKVYSGYIWGETIDFWQVRQRWVPGHQGHIYLCTSVSDVPLKRTLDGYASAPQTVSASITQVTDIVFGPAAPGQSYPSIYFYGKVSEVRGLYRSDDNFATTPKLLTQFPGNCCDGVVSLGASPNKYGRIYVGFAGSGWMYADYDAPLTAS